VQEYDLALHRINMPKRRRRQKKATVNVESRRTLTDYAMDDDDSFRIDTDACIAEIEQGIIGKPKPPVPVLRLLRKRETASAGSWAPQRSQWQTKMLVKSLEEDAKPVTPENSKPRKGWRSFAERSVPFTKLNTPDCDAILAIDRHGNYVVALTDMSDERGNSGNVPSSLLPDFALRFYGETHGIPTRNMMLLFLTNLACAGIPSPTVLSSEKQEQAPLLQTVSLRPGQTSNRYARSSLPADMLDVTGTLTLLVKPKGTQQCSRRPYKYFDI
jgi:hypothetical protein